MSIWIGLTWWVIGGLFGWVGGYCYGWIMGTKDTERRWSEAVNRKADSALRLGQPHGWCVNCAEENDGGYETENVGPFCSMCWEYLKEYFGADRTP